MTFEVVRTIAASRYPGQRRRNNVDSPVVPNRNKMLLLSEYRQNEPNYPVLHVVPEYDPDMPLYDLKLQAKNCAGILHSSHVLENGLEIGLVYVVIKAGTEENIFIILSMEEYRHFLQFLPQMLPPEVGCWFKKLKRGLGCKLLNMSGIPSSDLKLENQSFLRSLYRSYVKFLTSCFTSKEQFKEKMSSQDDLLSFLASLGWTDQQLLHALSLFIFRNKCRNRQCPAFSRLMCEGCHVVHYCNVDCQVCYNISLCSQLGLSGYFKKLHMFHKNLRLSCKFVRFL